ncbi:MAG: hypothetical protein J6S75_06055, partial [Thermoguttaceae bacterium]|nr:hypothetical protein [Thermoguttaceae bacterium]
MWWYREPSIIDTFMEAYDFTGKTVIPFVASSMNGIGDSGKNTRALAPGGKSKPANGLTRTRPRRSLLTGARSGCEIGLECRVRAQGKDP